MPCSQSCQTKSSSNQDRDTRRTRLRIKAAPDSLSVLAFGYWVITGVITSQVLTVTQGCHLPCQHFQQSTSPAALSPEPGSAAQGTAGNQRPSKGFVQQSVVGGEEGRQL